MHEYIHRPQVAVKTWCSKSDMTTATMDHSVVFKEYEILLLEDSVITDVQNNIM